jgi:hypothetical protein
VNRNANDDGAGSVGALAVGDTFRTLAVTVSAAANERYWASAGADHPLLRAGALYPPIAANLTVMLVQQSVGETLLHTAQTLVSHATGDAGQELRVTGAVRERFERRGREYAVVEATVTGAGGDVLWESHATFTPAAAPETAPASRARSSSDRAREPEPIGPGARHRTLHLDAAMLRAYSRAGNFHSDAEEARRLGMPGLVAQGMQVCGPAYGVLLDAWGADFLASGRFGARFVGMVVDGQSVDAAVELDARAGAARFEVRGEGGRVVALGDASRVTRSAAPD